MFDCDLGDDSSGVVCRRDYAVADGRRNGCYLLRDVVEVYFGRVAVLAVATVVGFDAETVGVRMCA